MQSYCYSNSATLTSYLGVESDADATFAIVGRHGDLSGASRAVGIRQELVIAWSRIIIVVVGVVTYFWVLQTTDRWLCKFVAMADYIDVVLHAVHDVVTNVTNKALTRWTRSGDDVFPVWYGQAYVHPITCKDLCSTFCTHSLTIKEPHTQGTTMPGSRIKCRTAV
jgi:hypothetical protein